MEESSVICDLNVILAIVELLHLHRVYFTVSQGNVTVGIHGNWKIHGSSWGDGNTGHMSLLWVVLQGTRPSSPLSEARDCESSTSSFWAEPIRAEFHWYTSEEQCKLQILPPSYILAHIRAHICPLVYRNVVLYCTANS